MSLSKLSLLDGAASPVSSPPPTSALKARLTQDMKAAMVSKDKTKLAAIRAILTAVKQKEVDNRVEQR
ncbi:hypothetical protein EON63_03430 [archaeon]|nr:MAG: hypothetical protein EON63_03430 [archaeon]